MSNESSLISAATNGVAIVHGSDVPLNASLPSALAAQPGSSQFSARCSGTVA
jgi:hypothetical protein